MNKILIAAAVLALGINTTAQKIEATSSTEGEIVVSGINSDVIDGNSWGVYGEGYDGVRGKAKGESGFGVYGLTIGEYGWGVYARAEGAEGRGISGQATGMNGVGVYGIHDNSTGKNPGVYGLSSSVDNAAVGVKGEINALTTGTSASGVKGIINDTAANGRGVYGLHNGNGVGIYGKAIGENGTGVYGIHSDNNGTTPGVYGVSNSPVSGATGILGEISSTSSLSFSAGVRGINKGTGGLGFGVYGSQDGAGTGVYGVANGSGSGIGVSGRCHGNNAKGVSGSADGEFGKGVYGSAEGKFGIGVYGRADSTNGVGVIGFGPMSGFDFNATGPGVNYGSTSSRRWKNNIKNISDPLDKINQLRGVYYDWDVEHGGQHDIGFIAEEVGMVLPEIVVFEENGVDASGMDYSKMTPLLVEAVNAMRLEYETRLDAQQEEIDRLNQLTTQMLFALSKMDVVIKLDSNSNSE